MSNVMSAPPGSRWFDCDTPLNASAAAAFAAEGFVIAGRYIGRNAGLARGDLGKAEAATILAAGLGIVLIQHVLAPGWTPSGSLGDLYGEAAAGNAALLGAPPGTTIFLDLESINLQTPAAIAAAYVNTWTKHVSAAGFKPGLYVGVSCGLTPAQLYADLALNCYWHSGSRSAPEVDKRGCVARQTIAGAVLARIAYDSSTADPDLLGGALAYWAPAASSGLKASPAPVTD
jgi:hypothetical protein